jgi:hypothetical protein
MDASPGAAMLCVGVDRTETLHRGPGRFDGRDLGCAGPLSRRDDPPAGGGATSSKLGWVVVEVDVSVDSSVLQHGVGEAQLRRAPLRVITARRSRFTDIHDVRSASEGNRHVWAHLDRSLACWRQRYPDLDLRVVAVGGSAVNDLTKHAADVQLVVVGRDGRSDVRDLLGPIGSAARHDTDCSSSSAIGVNCCECP